MGGCSQPAGWSEWVWGVLCCNGVRGVPAELAAVFPRESSAQVSAELYQEAAAPAGGSARGWGSPSSWSCQRGAAGQPASWAVPLLPITCPRPSLQSASPFLPGCMMQTAPEAACFAFLQVRHSPCLIFGWVNHRVRSVAWKWKCLPCSISRSVKKDAPVVGFNLGRPAGVFVHSICSSHCHQAAWVFGWTVCPRGAWHYCIFAAKWVLNESCPGLP